jgi:hypothetical protein
LGWRDRSRLIKRFQAFCTCEGLLEGRISPTFKV